MWTNEYIDVRGIYSVRPVISFKIFQHVRVLSIIDGKSWISVLKSIQRALKNWWYIWNGWINVAIFPKLPPAKPSQTLSKIGLSKQNR